MKRTVFILGIVSVLNIFASCASNKVVPYDTKEGNITEVIQLSDGMVRGVYNQDKSVELYAGIPFAAPPTGDLRWKEPAPVIPWEGIRDCDHFAPMCMQTQRQYVVSSICRNVDLAAKLVRQI